MHDKELQSARRTPRKSSRWLASLAVVLVGACGLGLDNDALFSRASEAMEQHDLRTAIIDLKTILQRDPGHADARLLLGKAYLDAADPLAAEKELRRAIELGVPPGLVLVPLCKALLAQQAHEMVLEEAAAEADLAVADRVELNLIRGEAELALGRATAAREQYVAALEADPGNGRAYLGMASAAIANGEPDQAAQYLDRAIEVSPELPLAWLARGEFSMGRREVDAARENLARALELATGPKDATVQQNALAGLTDVYLIKGDLRAADDTVAQLKSVAADSLLARYSEARVEFAKGELDTAVQLLQGILKDTPDFRKAHLLFGAVSRAKGNLAQAEMYLASVVAKWPDNEQARRLLADVRLRQNKLAGATEALEPLLADEGADDQLLAAAGVVKIQAGEGSEGLELFERSVAADPGNTERKMDLAALYLAAGRLDDAISLLESLRGSGADEIRLNILEMLTMERGGATQEALQRAEQLLAGHPDNTQLLLVAGNLYQRAGRSSDARAMLRRATELQPGMTTAMLSLGRLEASAGRIEQARLHYRRALQVDPDNAQIMMQMSELAMAGGDIATAVSWLERARDRNATAILPRVRLVTHYLSQNRLDEATAVAEEAVRINSQDARAQNILGVTQMASGNFAAASGSFAEAVRVAPNVPAYALNHARAELQRGNDVAAWKMMRESYEAHPNHVATAMQLAAFHMRYRRFDEARDIALRLQSALPGNAAGFALEAEVLAAQSSFADAAALYDRALQIENTRKLAVRAFQLRKSASSPDPFEPLVNYLNANSGDTAARMQLAEALLANGETDTAAEHYEKVLASNPYNLVALNNLAWILVEKGDSRAREFAEVAYGILPDNAAIVDTYGYVLLKLGDAEKATEVLRNAVEAMPDNDGIRSRLDEALEQAGSGS